MGIRRLNQLYRTVKGPIMDGNIRSGAPGGSFATFSSFPSVTAVSPFACAIPSILSSCTTFAALASFTTISSVASLTSITGYQDIPFDGCHRHGNRSRIRTGNAVTAISSIMSCRTVTSFFPCRLTSSISSFCPLGTVSPVSAISSVSATLSCKYKGTFHVGTSFLPQII